MKLNWIAIVFLLLTSVAVFSLFSLFLQTFLNGVLATNIYWIITSVVKVYSPRLGEVFYEG